MARGRGFIKHRRTVNPRDFGHPVWFDGDEVIGEYLDLLDRPEIVSSTVNILCYFTRVLIRHN